MGGPNPLLIVRKIGLLRSVSQEEIETGSDFDLTVRPGHTDLLTFISLWQYLEGSFGKKIDLVSQGGLRRGTRDVVFVWGMNPIS